MIERIGFSTFIGIIFKLSAFIAGKNMTNKQRAILIDLNTKPHPVSEDASQLRKRLAVIVREIIDAAEITMIAFGLDEYGTKYRMGTFIWDRLFTSLPRILANDKNWSVSTKSNVLILRTNINGVSFAFYIPKVDTDNRVPTGAKSIKDIAKGHEMLFLSDELREIVTASSPIIIGYDITPQVGLGSITINEVIYMNGNDFFSPTIAELYTASAENILSVPQETIQPVKVTKTTAKVTKDATNAGGALAKANK